MMRGAAATLRAELIGLGGVVERNVYLTRRYIWWDVAFLVWTIANTLTIVFIAKGIEATGGSIDVDRATTQLLIGAVVWAYLGIIFEFMTETVAWERWEGTIEYTFMAPLSRAMHLAGAGFFAVLYGLIRAIILFVVVAFFFDLEMPDANFPAAFVVLVIASLSFFGIGDDDRGAAADLAREGRAARLRRAGHAARRLGRLLPGRGAAAVDAVALDDLAGDVRAGRHPRGDPRRRRALDDVGRDLAAARDRRRLDPARAVGLQARRDLRQEAREAEAIGMSDAATTGRPYRLSSGSGHPVVCVRRRLDDRASFFVRELHMSPLQLVLTGTALEVRTSCSRSRRESWPTRTAGAFDDHRVAGLGVGFVVTGLANGVPLVLVAAAFMGFVWTFKSGSEEAWITDEARGRERRPLVPARRAGVARRSLSGSARRWASR